MPSSKLSRTSSSSSSTIDLDRRSMVSTTPKDLARSTRSKGGIETGWLPYLLKIAALSKKVAGSSEFQKDSDFTLKILREASALTKPWLSSVGEELRQQGLHRSSSDCNYEDEHRELRKASKAGLLAFCTTLAAVGWRASRKRGKEKKLWKAEMVQYMHKLLKDRLEEAERDIKRLERKLEGRHHGRSMYSGRRSIHVGSDDGYQSRYYRQGHNFQIDAQPYTAASHTQSLVSNSRSEIPRRTQQVHELPIHYGSERHVEGRQQYDMASLAGSMHSKARSGSLRSGTRSQPSSTIRSAADDAHDRAPPTSSCPQQATTQYSGSSVGFEGGVQQSEIPIERTGSRMSYLPPNAEAMAEVSTLRSYPGSRHGNDVSQNQQGAPYPENVPTMHGRASSTSSVLSWLSGQPASASSHHDAGHTTEMPPASSIATSSQYTRQTRAPTVRSTKSSAPTVGPMDSQSQGVGPPQFAPRLPSDNGARRTSPHIPAVHSPLRHSTNALDDYVQNTRSVPSNATHSTYLRPSTIQSSSRQQRREPSATAHPNIEALRTTDLRSALSEASSRHVWSIATSDTPTRPSSMMPAVGASSPPPSEAPTVQSSARKHTNLTGLLQTPQDQPSWDFANIQSPPASVRSSTRGKKRSVRAPSESRSSSHAPSGQPLI